MIKIKAVCIIGSPRNNGSTALVVDKIVKGMEEAGVVVRRYVLGYLNINYCEGCNYCYSMRKCKQHDDVNAIYEDLLESDVVLVASPSYWGDVTGQLKVFFDRSTPYCDTGEGGNIVPEGKYGISVAIRAGQRKNETNHIIDTIEHYFGHLNIKPIERFTMESIHGLDDFEGREDELQLAYNIGLNIKETIKNKKVI